MSQILVCGDQRGNIAAFSVPLFSPLVGLSVSSQQPFASFKGAHGISTVASIHIAGKRNQHQIKICSVSCLSFWHMLLGIGVAFS